MRGCRGGPACRTRRRHGWRTSAGFTARGPCMQFPDRHCSAAQDVWSSFETLDAAKKVGGRCRAKGKGRGPRRHARQARLLEGGEGGWSLPLPAWHAGRRCNNIHSHHARIHQHLTLSWAQVVKLKAFSKFENTAEALQAAASIVDSKLSKGEGNPLPLIPLPAPRCRGCV